MARTFPRGILIMLLPLIIGGCGSSDETYQEAPPPPIPPPYVIRDTIRIETPVAFQVQSDTVAPRSGPAAGHDLHTSAVPDIRYSVQIGSFKIAANAADVQARARERYGIPVVNDFNTVTGLYQIRIGFFASRESAMDLRNRLAREFPAEYGDAWVVRLTP
jgi:cell division protein FtsN